MMNRPFQKAPFPPGDRAREAFSVNPCLPLPPALLAMEGLIDRQFAVYAVLLLLGATVSVKVCDGAAADTSACPTALTKLLPCLPYAQGTAPVPASDCCTNLKTIHETEPQCLCALIAASVTGSAGLPKMNTTLSLMLGPACNVATKPARCPDLLGLAANDPLVKIFEGASTSAPSSNSSTPAAKGPPSSGSPIVASPPKVGNNANAILGSGALLCSFVLFVLPAFIFP